MQNRDSASADQRSQSRSISMSRLMDLPQGPIVQVGYQVSKNIKSGP